MRKKRPPFSYGFFYLTPLQKRYWLTLIIKKKKGEKDANRLGNRQTYRRPS